MMSAVLKANSLHNVVGKDGKSCTASATETVWVAYEKQEFSGVTTHNSVKPYTTGQAYYDDLIAAIKGANEEIMIAGWQVNWDALLAPKVRLFDVLLEAAKKDKMQIFVMPWDDNAPVQTFDDQTESVLKMINDVVDKKVVRVLRTGSLADESRSFFSHHQKQVVIDRKIAFVGGIDLAYGRFDDAKYDLHANAQGREVLNRYNGCIAQVGKTGNGIVTVDPDKLTGGWDRVGMWNDSNRTVIRKKILEGAWQTQYQEDSQQQQKSGGSNLKALDVTIDAAIQPRMPWQDVHTRIEGPAVSDLSRNFIGRWNAQGGTPKLKEAMPASNYPQAGSCQIQVLRSASKGLREAEYKNSTNAEKNATTAPSAAENDIERAMEKLILKAQHFIYIENQFFVSDFGKPHGFDVDQLSGPAKQANTVKWGLDQSTGAYLSTTWMAGDQTSATKLPKNQICATLAKRIDIAIQDKKKHPFHVIITLPVHPEGPLNNGAVMTQIHWTMQALVFGTHSLLNRIRRSLRAQQLREKKDADFNRAYRDNNDEYKDIPIKDCFKYVTLLNLRNWEKIGDRYVTEQIYVHSKLMIVDDRYALLGSANINDRSLLGTRDSELAVLIVDEKVERKDTCGDGKALPVRGFAHDLRREVWRNIFGLTGNVRPATELEKAVDHPGAPASWKAIQKVAMGNTKLYEDAFKYIPRNKDPNDKNKVRTSSIWPVWDAEQKDLKKAKKYPMPFDVEFWKYHQNDPDASVKLTQVKGFITTLPIEWTMGENNNFGYHMALVAENNVPTNMQPESPQKTRAWAKQSPTNSNGAEEAA